MQSRYGPWVFNCAFLRKTCFYTLHNLIYPITGTCARIFKINCHPNLYSNVINQELIKLDYNYSIIFTNDLKFNGYKEHFDIIILFVSICVNAICILQFMEKRSSSQQAKLLLVLIFVFFFRQQGMVWDDLVQRPLMQI